MSASYRGSKLDGLNYDGGPNTTAAFVTFQKPCEEALRDLSEAYNRLADRWETQHDLLRRLREWDIIAGYSLGEFTADAPYWRGELDKVLR